MAGLGWFVAGLSAWFCVFLLRVICGGCGDERVWFCEKQGALKSELRLYNFCELWHRQEREGGVFVFVVDEVSVSCVHRKFIANSRF